MRRSMAVVVALTALTASLVLAASASAGVVSQTVLVTSLSGQEEVNADGVPGQGDPDGRGFAIIRIDTEADEVCWTIFVRRIDLPAIAAHIHEAPAGVNGPIVVPLTPPDGFVPFLPIGLSRGCAISEDFADAVAANPSGFYVNVHTTPFPGGAVRGQL